MKKRLIKGVFVAVLAGFVATGVFQTSTNAASSGGTGGHPAFKSPMNNYTPRYISVESGKSLYGISYEYSVSGISNANQ